jgi:hypothetical protein
VQAKYPEFAGEGYASVIAASAPTQDYNLKADYVKANAEQGLFGKLLLGGILGAALAAVVVFAGYFLDPRIKSVKELLPEEKSTVLQADAENAVLALTARIKAQDAQSILIASLTENAAFADFAERTAAYLAQSGAPVQVIAVDTNNAAWLTQLDGAEKNEGFVICLCNGASNEVLSYLSGKTDATALFVDHKKVLAKKLRAAASEVGDGAYLCTLLHNVGRAYLD